MVKQSAFSFFTDFVYDDVLSMSRVDQEFNLFKAFVVEGKDPMTKENIKKSFTLDDVINGRNTFYSEIKDAVEKKFKIALKIWLRIRNLDKMSQLNGGGGSN